jgi:hypothetical protein
MDPDPKTDKVITQVQSDMARTALRRWVLGKAGKLILADWTASGFSEAQLIGAYFRARGEPPRSLIIKISSKDRGDREEQAHRNALKDATAEFARDHMAELVGDPIPVDGGEWISFQQVAGGGFGEMAEFDEMLSDWDGLAQVCRRIIDSLFKEWNDDPDDGEATVGVLLTELLGDRLAAGGTIRAWAAHVPQLLDQPRRWLRYGGYDLINPLALVSGDAPERRIPVIVVRGKSHGDLHPGNLMVGRRQTPERPKYCLVDLSRYRADGLLAWDPAYLMVTTVAKYLMTNQVEIDMREPLRQWLVHPDSTEPSLRRELRAVISGINQAGTEYANASGMIPEWRSQRLLCITAAALVLTGRRTLLSAVDLEWFFWLAAHAATELVRRKTGHTPENPLTLPDPLMSDGNVVGLDRRRRRAQLDPPQASAQPSTVTPIHDHGTWTRLAEELRAVQLDAGDRATFASRTEALRQLLAEPRGPAPVHRDRVEKYLGEFTQTLSDALRPATTNAEVRAAGTHAELLRVWLVDLLS